MKPVSITSVTKGAFHLVKISGIFGSAVNGTRFVGSSHWKIPRKRGKSKKVGLFPWLEFPNGMSCSIYVSRSLYQFQVHGRAPRRTGVYDQMEQVFTNQKFHFYSHRNFRVFFLMESVPNVMRWLLRLFRCVTRIQAINLICKVKYNVLIETIWRRFLVIYFIYLSYSGYVPGVRWQCLCAIIMLIIFCTFVLTLAKYFSIMEERLTSFGAQYGFKILGQKAWFLAKRTIAFFSLKRARGKRSQVQCNPDKHRVRHLKGRVQYKCRVSAV